MNYTSRKTTTVRFPSSKKVQQKSAAWVDKRFYADEPGGCYNNGKHNHTTQCDIHLPHVVLKTDIESDGTKGKKKMNSTGIAHPESQSFPVMLTPPEDWQVKEKADVHEKTVGAWSQEAVYTDPQEDYVSRVICQPLP